MQGCARFCASIIAVTAPRWCTRYSARARIVRRHMRVCHAPAYIGAVRPHAWYWISLRDPGAVNDLSEMCHAADMSPANLRALDSRALVTWAIA